MGDDAALNAQIRARGMIEPAPVRTTMPADLAARLDVVCDTIANGGNLIDLASSWGIRYSELVDWLGSDRTRKARFDHANAMRDEWSVQAMLRQIHRLLNVDIRDAYNEWNGLRSVQELDPATAAALVGVKTREEYDTDTGERRHCATVIEVKFSDRLKAIELLGKQLQLYLDKRIAVYNATFNIGNASREQLIPVMSKLFAKMGRAFDPSMMDAQFSVANGTPIPPTGAGSDRGGGDHLSLSSPTAAPKERVPSTVAEVTPVPIDVAGSHGSHPVVAETPVPEVCIGPEIVGPIEDVPEEPV